MLVGPVSRSVRQTLQEEDWAFIAQECLLRFPNVHVCPSFRTVEKQRKRDKPAEWKFPTLHTLHCLHKSKVSNIGDCDIIRTLQKIFVLNIFKFLHYIYNQFPLSLSFYGYLILATTRSPFPGVVFSRFFSMTTIYCNDSTFFSCDNMTNISTLIHSVFLSVQIKWKGEKTEKQFGFQFCDPFQELF